jgi:hypothetical protein
LLFLLFTSSIKVVERVKAMPASNNLSENQDRRSICDCNMMGLANDGSNVLSNDSFRAMQQSKNGSILAGWTPSPQGRGTIDILWTCGATISLCCWTALCLNVPPPEWGRWRRLGQKVLIGYLSMIGPEFICQLALGQWASARNSVGDFKRSGYHEWSMCHAFVADMGGFVLHAPDWVPFPLNAKQVHYLVTKGYVPYSAVRLDKSLIHDKNKGDGVVRLIAVSQMLWFSINCLGRVTQNLAITTLELTTLGFIFCTLATYFFWAHKPMDIQTAIVLEPNTTIADILVEAGDRAREPYRLTPLDFVGRSQSPWSLYWSHSVNLFRPCHNKVPWFAPRDRRPVDMIPDDHFPDLSREMSALLFSLQCGYAAIHLCGWNFYFPSRLERTLWHMSAITIIVAIVLYWTVELCVWTCLPAVKMYCTKHRRSDGERQSHGDTRRRAPHLVSRAQIVAAHIRNNSPGRDPALYVPIKALLPVSTLAVCYCIARWYIYVEDLLNLRALPSSVFDTVNWSEFWPHIS